MQARDGSIPLRMQARDAHTSRDPYMSDEESISGSSSSDEALGVNQNLALVRYVHGGDFADWVFLHASSNTEWRDEYVDAASLRDLGKNVVPLERVVGSSEYSELVEPDGACTKLFSKLEIESNKVEAFYKATLAESLARVNNLLKLDVIADDDVHSCSELRGARAEALSIREKYSEEMQNRRKLNEFCLVNRAALSEVLTRTEGFSGASLLLSRLHGLQFWEHTGLVKLQEATVSGFAKQFCGGHLAIAEVRLRMQERTHGNVQTAAFHKARAFRTGIPVGISVALTVWTVWSLVIVHKVQSEPFNPQCLGDLMHVPANATDTMPLQLEAVSIAQTLYRPIFYAMAEMVMWCYCWCFLLYVWEANGFHYRALLKLSPFGPKADDVFQLASVLVIMFCMGLMVSAEAFACMLGRVTTPIGFYPLIMYVGIILYAMQWNRLGLPRLVLATIISPFSAGGVSALHGYVGDVLTSLIKPINGLAYGGCVFLTGEFALPLTEQGSCYQKWFKSKGSARLTIFILLFPSLLRMAQNLRQLYDSGKQHPNLTNTGKYTLGFLVSVFALMHETPALDGDNDWFFYVFLVPYLGSTIYSFLWDIFMDWKLFDSPRTCLCFPCGGCHLRERRLLGKRWVYYAAMVADFVLRFFHTYTLVPKATAILNNDTTMWLGYVSPILELLRRTMWSVFKMENMELTDMATVPTLPHEESADTVRSHHRKLMIEILAFITVVTILTILEVV